MAGAPVDEANGAGINPAFLRVDCPSRRILQLIGDKWTPIVLYCLSHGTLRFAVLHRYIPDISKKMLTQVLRQLEADGLVQRVAYPVMPLKTEYCLTELGQHVHEPVALLCAWAEANAEVLDGIARTRALSEARKEAVLF